MQIAGYEPESLQGLIPAATGWFHLCLFSGKYVCLSLLPGERGSNITSTTGCRYTTNVVFYGYTGSVGLQAGIKPITFNQLGSQTSQSNEQNKERTIKDWNRPWRDKDFITFNSVHCSPAVSIKSFIINEFVVLYCLAGC